MFARIKLEAVKELLASGKTEPAADLLLKLAKKSDKAHYHSALLLKNRVETLQHRAIEGVLSQSEERVEWARISKGIMELAIQMERGEKPTSESSFDKVPTSPRKKTQLKAWYFALPAILLLLLVFLPKIFNLTLNLPNNHKTPSTEKIDETGPQNSKLITLPGRVTNPYDKPVAGASVIFEGYGKAIQATTNQMGRFEVTVPEDMVGKQVDLTIIHNGKKDPNKRSIRFSKALLPRLKYGG